MTQPKLPAPVGNPRAVEEYDGRESGVKGGKRAVCNRSVGVDLPKQGLFNEGVYSLEPCLIERVAHEVTVSIVYSGLVKPGGRAGEGELEEHCQERYLAPQPERAHCRLYSVTEFGSVVVTVHWVAEG